MKNGFKRCAVALAISTVITGCNDDSTTSVDNNGNTYMAPIASELRISGDSYVNSTLTANYKFIDPNYSPRPEGNSVYSWHVDDSDNDLSNDLSIDDAKSKILLLTDSEVDQLIYFCVTPVVAGGTATTGDQKCSTSVLVAAGNGNKPVASNVSIVDATDESDVTAPSVGDTLTGDYDYSDDDNDPQGTSTFRWIAGSDIIGATAQTLKLTNQQEGKAVRFCVTPISTNPDSIANSPLVGDEVCSTATDATAPLAGAAPTASKPTISGGHVVGSTLTATYVYDDADDDLEGSSLLEWKRDETTIANGLSYTLVTTDIGKSITFVVTPFAQTGVEKQGTPMPSDAITDVKAPEGPVPTVTLSTVTNDSGTAYPEVGDALTASYNYIESSSGAIDASTAQWKAGGITIESIDCATGTSCVLPLTEAQLNQDLTYCVTPKAVDSAAGQEVCSDPTKAYGVALTGTLEFGKELKLAVSGYENPTIEWQVDISDITGPLNSNQTPTTRNTVTKGVTAQTFLIGDEVFKKIRNDDQDIRLDLDQEIGNKNDLIDDADWAQASLKGFVTMDSNSAAANTINAAHYIGKDVTVTVTVSELNVDPITLTASTTKAVKGGVFYDKDDASKRGIEPVRELEFGPVVYHRPITLAEAHHNKDVGFGANVAYPRYTKTASGIEWAVYRAIKNPLDGDNDVKNIPFNNSPFPAVDSCLNLYDGDNDLWHLPVSRSDSQYTENGYADQGNKPPMGNDVKAYTLIKLANSIHKDTNLPTAGLLGTYIARGLKPETQPNPKLTYTISPTTGRLLNGDDGSTAHWSATTLTADGRTNSVLFYEAGGSGNNDNINGRFVSCVRAKTTEEPTE